MKIKELLEKYGEVEISEEKEKEIKNLLGVKENKNKKWKPEENEPYYYIENSGCICESEWADDSIDNKRLIFDNIFKTEEEAEFRLEQIKVYNELKNFADENDDKIDWYNDNQSKYYMYFGYGANNNILIYDTLTAKDIGQIYFSSKELAEQAIKIVGEDKIKKYLFGVE